MKKSVLLFILFSLTLATSAQQSTMVAKVESAMFERTTSVSNRLHTIPRGTSVRVVGEDGAFVRIEFRNSRGYVNKLNLETRELWQERQQRERERERAGQRQASPAENARRIEQERAENARRMEQERQQQEDRERQSFVDSWRRNGLQNVEEGIYEMAIRRNNARYEVAVKNRNGTLLIIYLSGSANNARRFPGNTVATLVPTATPLFYRANWVIMPSRTTNNDYFVSFEQGTMTVIPPRGDRELYIKMFPTAVAGTPSGGAGSGTGFALSSNGYIVTNHHVIEDARRVRVKGIDGNFSRTYNARIVAQDRNNDLAIIKIDDQNFTSLGRIPYTISAQGANVGSSIFVLGYPLRATMGDELKLTDGRVSSRSGFQGDPTSYQITAPIQPGNSGSPLFDSRGNIIGVVTAKHLGAQNVGYAVRSSFLMNLVQSMNSPPTMPTSNTVSTLSLEEQVRVLRRFVYIIEVE